MSLDGPTYLASLQNNIRHRPIPWDGAVRAGSLTEEQLAKIRAVDKAKRPEQRKEIVSADLDGYRLLFVGGNGSPSVLEKAGKNTSLVQYILVLLADLLDGKSGLSVYISMSKHKIVFQHPTSGISPAIQVLCAAIGKISFSSPNYTALFYIIDFNLVLTIFCSRNSCAIPRQGSPQVPRAIPALFAVIPRSFQRGPHPPPYRTRLVESYGSGAR